MRKRSSKYSDDQEKSPLPYSELRFLKRPL